jgi:hypothetical protein
VHFGIQNIPAAREVRVNAWIPNEASSNHSNLLHSQVGQPLEARWLSIPTNVWHRPVMGEVDWAVVSFHTASDTALLEKLPLDDEQPDRGTRASTLYAGRDAR